VDFTRTIAFNKGYHGVGLSMKRLVLILLLLAQPAWAQVKLVPKEVTKRADNCAPIGRTEDGKLVYAMKCEIPLRPATAAVAPQAAVNPDAEAKSETETETTTERSGLFGLSYDRRPKQ
jgi:hypothetical protein